jgi:hypothetical protein
VCHDEDDDDGGGGDGDGDGGDDNDDDNERGSRPALQRRPDKEVRTSDTRARRRCSRHGPVRKV